jgi:HD-GYP domain-containing protein (c-di-GMP phosphodiesterase class II)
MNTVRKIALTLALALTALAAFSQEAVQKAIDETNHQLILRDFDKAFSYAQFVMRFYKGQEMSAAALDVCERAVKAKADQLKSQEKWRELQALPSLIPYAPASILSKIDDSLKMAAQKMKEADEAQAKQEAEAKRVEDEKQRQAAINAALEQARQLEATKEAQRERERQEAAAREAKLMADREKAEANNQAQIDKLISENQKLEALKEAARSAERQAYEKRQADLLAQKTESDARLQEQVNRILDQSQRSGDQALKTVAKTNFAVIIGLAILGALCLGGLFLLVWMGLRQQRQQQEQFTETLKTFKAMQSTSMNPALPYLSFDSGLAALPGAAPQQGLLGAPSQGALPPPSQDASNLKALIEKCQGYSTEIDRVTNRKNSSRLVAELVYKISRHLGYSEQDSYAYFAVGLVYDIGFLNIDPALLRAERITEEQFKTIQTHTTLGAAMVFFVEDGYRELFKDGVSKHHENLDGSGYPAGLKGDAIPYIARVLRVAESYIALISSREYRQIKDRDAAIQDLRDHDKHYDKAIVDALNEIV